LASSSKVQSDFAVKTRSERTKIQRETKEEKRVLNDLNFTFQIFERNRDKPTKVLNEPKLQQDELKRLKTETNQIEKVYRKIIVTDKQLSDTNFRPEQSQSDLDVLHLENQ
jgi:hypothetical protein